MFVTKTPLNCFALFRFLPTNVTVLELVEACRVGTRARGARGGAFGGSGGVEGDFRAGNAQKMSKAVAKNQP